MHSSAALTLAAWRGAGLALTLARL